MASDALRNGLDALPNICRLKSKNKCPFCLGPLIVPCCNPGYVPHWKVVVTIGALYEWPWMPPKSQHLLPFSYSALFKNGLAPLNS